MLGEIKKYFCKRFKTWKTDEANIYNSGRDAVMSLAFLILIPAVSFIPSVILMLRERADFAAAFSIPTLFMCLSGVHDATGRWVSEEEKKTRSVEAPKTGIRLDTRNGKLALRMGLDTVSGILCLVTMYAKSFTLWHAFVIVLVACAAVLLVSDVCICCKASLHSYNQRWEQEEVGDLYENENEADS